MSLATPVLGKPQAERLLAAVASLDEMASVAELTRYAVPG
jgi:hypothetical protein